MTKPKTLTGDEKAALLIIGLDRDVATALLSQLTDDELKRVTAAYTKVEDRSYETVTKVFNDFVSALQAPAALPPPNNDAFKELVTSAVGEQRSKKVFAVEKPKGRWDLLRQLDPKTVAAILANEHPQAVAALLYQLEEDLAGALLKALPNEMVTEVVGRIGKLKNVGDEAIADIEQVLTATLGEPKAVEDPTDGVAKAATLVNFLDTEAAQAVVDSVGNADQKLGDAIRKARFTVEDLMKVDNKGLQQVLREIASDRLLLALKTATQDLREKLLGCVSSRVADSIREELGNMGPTKLSDVEAAQREVIEVALRLQKEGKLQIAGQSTGEQMV